VWNTGGCSSWYLDAQGKNRVLWGGYTWQYWLATRKLKRSDHRFFGKPGDEPLARRAKESDTRTHDVVLPGVVAPQG
jgi:hypothetical protein